MTPGRASSRTCTTVISTKFSPELRKYNIQLLKVSSLPDKEFDSLCNVSCKPSNGNRRSLARMLSGRSNSPLAKIFSALDLLQCSGKNSLDKRKARNTSANKPTNIYIVETFGAWRGGFQTTNGLASEFQHLFLHNRDSARNVTNRYLLK